MSGELNGTDCLLAIDVADNATFVGIGGMTTNSLTLNNTAIDITNKGSSSWRELLGGEGLQAMDFTGEMVFSTDSAFDAMKTQALSKTLKAYEIARGSETVTGTFYITSYGETSPDNEKVTATVSLQSSGPVTGL